MHRTKRRLILSILPAIACLLPVQIAGAEDAPLSNDVVALEDIPSVHNSFYQVPEGVVGWDVLGVLDIEIEVLGPLQTNATKTFSETVRALDGETIKVMGFLYPLKGGVTHDYFLLTAWPPSCPFCLPAGPTMMVETFAAEAIDFTEGAIVMAGQFELLENDPSGFFYRMQSAQLVERFDDIRWNGMDSLQPDLK
jgi:hypothetical protein